MRQTVLFFLLFSLSFSVFGFKVQDSIPLTDSVQVRVYKKPIVIDSAALARKNFIKDSLTWHFLKPDPNRPNPYVEKLLADNITTDPHLLSLPKKFKKVNNPYGVGVSIKPFPLWFLIASLTLLTVFAIIRLVFDKEMANVFKAFFNNRVLNQIDKEDNVLITWQFIFLYILFSLTIGLLVCLVMFKTSASDAATGFTSFLLISLAVFIFFGLKILTMKFLGFVFEIHAITKEYLNIVYLSYINSLFLLLPATFILTFVGVNYGHLVLRALLVLFAVLIGFQTVRLVVKILLNHRISKFYLFLYLCTLEICPIILFVKTINISL